MIRAVALSVACALVAGEGLGQTIHTPRSNFPLCDPHKVGACRVPMETRPAGARPGEAQIPGQKGANVALELRLPSAARRAFVAKIQNDAPGVLVLGAARGKSIPVRADAEGRISFRYEVDADRAADAAPLTLEITAIVDAGPGGLAVFTEPFGQAFITLGKPDAVNPMQVCPAYPGRAGMGLIAATQGASAQIVFRGEPRRRVKMTIASGQGAISALRTGSLSPDREASVETDAGGEAKFWFHVPAGLRPPLPVTAELDASYIQTGSAAPQKAGWARVQVGIGIVLDPLRSRLFPFGDPANGPTRLAFLPAIRSAYDADLDLGEWHASARACDTEDVPVMQLKYRWTGAAPVATWPDNFYPAARPANGPQYLTPATRDGEKFGSLVLRRFSLKEPAFVGLTVTGWMANTGRDRLTSGHATAWSEENRQWTQEPPLFSRPAFLLAPLEKPEDWATSAACALEATSISQRVMLAALEAPPVIGTSIGFAMLGPQFACAWARADFDTALQVLMKEGGRQVAETLVLDYLSPAGLKAWSSRQTGDLHMSDQEIEQFANLVASAYTAAVKPWEKAVEPSAPRPQETPTADGRGALFSRPGLGDGAPARDRSGLPPLPPGARPGLAVGK
jgi:hypothetical protein